MMSAIHPRDVIGMANGIPVEGGARCRNRRLALAVGRDALIVKLISNAVDAGQTATTCAKFAWKQSA